MGQMGNTAKLKPREPRGGGEGAQITIGRSRGEGEECSGHWQLRGGSASMPQGVIRTELASFPSGSLGMRVEQSCLAMCG